MIDPPPLGEGTPIPTGPIRWERRWYHMTKENDSGFYGTPRTSEWFSYLVLQQWCATPEGFKWVDVLIHETPMPTEEPKWLIPSNPR